MQVDIVTDGSCYPNPGPGGYAAIIVYGSYFMRVWGGQESTTNARMELIAAIQALKAIPGKGRDILIHCDAKYVSDNVNTKRPLQWKRRGWKNSDDQRIKNRDLWELMIPELLRNNVRANWVKGHIGHPENELCDAMAKIQRIRHTRVPIICSKCKRKRFTEEPCIKCWGSRNPASKTCGTCISFQDDRCRRIDGEVSRTWTGCVLHVNKNTEVDNNE